MCSEEASRARLARGLWQRDCEIDSLKQLLHQRSEECTELALDNLRQKAAARKQLEEASLERVQVEQARLEEQQKNVELRRRERELADKHKLPEEQVARFLISIIQRRTTVEFEYCCQRSNLPGGHGHTRARTGGSAPGTCL